MKRLKISEVDGRLATCERLVDELIEDLGKEGPSLLRAAVMGMLMACSNVLDMARRHVTVHDRDQDGGRQLALILTIDSEGLGHIRNVGGDPNSDLLDDEHQDKVE